MFRLSHDRVLHGKARRQFQQLHVQESLKVVLHEGQPCFMKLMRHAITSLTKKKEKEWIYVYLYPISFAPLLSLLVGSAPGIGRLLSSGMI